MSKLFEAAKAEFSKVVTDRLVKDKRDLETLLQRYFPEHLDCFNVETNNGRVVAKIKDSEYQLELNPKEIVRETLILFSQDYTKTSGTKIRNLFDLHRALENVFTLGADDV